MLNNIGLDITDYYKPQLSVSPPKKWMSDIGKISNTPKLPMTKSTDSLWGGLKAGASKFMGKAGDEMKWLNQDMTSGLTDLAGKVGAGIGVGGMMDMAAGVVDSVAGAVGLKGAEVSTAGDGFLDMASSLPLEFIPGFGTIAKGGLMAVNLVNKYAGSSSHKQGTDLDMGIMGYNTDINENAGKKYSLLGRSARKKANVLTDSYDRENLSKYASTAMYKQNALASQNTTASIGDKNRMQLMGGYGTNILAARLGTRIPPVNLRKIANKAEWNKKKKLEEQKKKLEASKVLEKDTKYKDGGLLTKADKKEVIEEVVEEKMNVIPEGAFHSRKNNIHEDVAEHVTKKGIPVITKDEEGKVTQHAEVERNEIIFHKEATDTIESLHEKYKKAETQKLKDEIMIECGKYVADQILVNTDDRTGIIETIE